MMIRTLPLLAAAAMMSGCVTTQHYNEDGSIDARLGETVRFGSIRVTPLKVLEDSRCPMEARCIWAGRVKLSVRYNAGSGDRIGELASDQPLRLRDGLLELQSVMPPRSVRGTLVPRDYRFTLTFSGGI